MTSITKTEPHVLMQDNDGHWYFLPESIAGRFSELSELSAEYAPSDMDKHLLHEWIDMEQYLIEGPEVLRITSWLPY